MASSRNLRRYLLQAAAFGLVAGLAISVLWPRPELTRRHLQATRRP